MAISFYYSPRSAATRVLWALEELGIPFEKVLVDVSKGHHKKPEFLAINPNGEVPAMVDGDAKLFESTALLLHLGERYGAEKGLWPKAGMADRAEAICWTVWATIQIQDCADDHAMHSNEELANGLPKEMRSQRVLDDAKSQWDFHLAILDKRLAKQEFTIGNSFTLADIANAAAVGTGVWVSKLPVDAFKNVAAWLVRCQSRPAFGRAVNG